MNPLNPILYKHLLQKFKRVGITNEGMEARVTHWPDYTYRKGRLKAEVSDWGETYHVNCPFCTDTRGRLYINHLWAVRDPRTHDDMLHLAYCQNEQCVDSREKQKELHAMVFPRGRYADQVQLPIKPIKIDNPTSTPPIVLPVSVRLDKLDPKHPARSYLARRGYDAALLAAKYNVRFCEGDDSSRPIIREPRIIVPIYALPALTLVGSAKPPTPKLVGWQARLIRDDLEKHDIKYLTSSGTRKNRLLYRLPAASKSTGPAVLVEGVMDA